jgi:hypothetical protein
MSPGEGANKHTDFCLFPPLLPNEMLEELPILRGQTKFCEKFILRNVCNYSEFQKSNVMRESANNAALLQPGSAPHATTRARLRRRRGVPRICFGTLKVI